MKLKIKKKILFWIFVFGILICIFHFQKSNPKIQPAIPTMENPIAEFDFENELQILNACEIVTKAPVEKSKPFFQISENDRYNLCCIIAGEAQGEPIEGKMAVAQCLLNAMAKEGYTAEQVRIKYGYAGWNSKLQNSNPDLWAEVEEAVVRVFDNGETVSENPILFFYAPKRTRSKWHESLSYDQDICCHRFFYLSNDINADWFLNLKGEI